MKQPLQVYLDEDDRVQLESLKKALGQKTLSATLRKLIKLVFNLREVG
jgi:hypothetical protein